MTNHVHLVAVPESADSMARTLRRAHSQYAQWFNRRYHRSGHLWQGRFFSCSLGPDHLVTALAYVDLNPVRAGLVGWAEAVPQAQKLPRKLAAPVSLSRNWIGTRKGQAGKRLRPLFSFIGHPS